MSKEYVPRRGDLVMLYGDILGIVVHNSEDDLVYQKIECYTPDGDDCIYGLQWHTGTPKPNSITYLGNIADSMRPIYEETNK